MADIWLQYQDFPTCKFISELSLFTSKPPKRQGSAHTPPRPGEAVQLLCPPQPFDTLAHHRVYRQLTTKGRVSGCFGIFLTANQTLRANLIKDEFQQIFDSNNILLLVCLPIKNNHFTIIISLYYMRLVTVPVGQDQQTNNLGHSGYLI